MLNIIHEGNELDCGRRHEDFGVGNLGIYAMNTGDLR